MRRAEIAFLELPKPVAPLYALMLVRAYAEADDPKFERAAVRWLQQRLADGGLMLDEARVACEWLSALRGQTPTSLRPRSGSWRTGGVEGGGRSPPPA